MINDDVTDRKVKACVQSHILSLFDVLRSLMQTGWKCSTWRSEPQAVQYNKTVLL